MIGLVLIVAVMGYFAVCLVKGFTSLPSLAQFHGQHSVVHRFRNAVDMTRDAYRNAISRTPGMRLIGDDDGVLFIDSRPTARIIDGNFGMAISLVFTADSDGCVVTAEAMNKVPFAIANHAAAFRHVERSLRMKAKEHGIEERIDGIDD